MTQEELEAMVTRNNNLYAISHGITPLAVAPEEDYEICGWCGDEDHVQEDCPEYQQAMADERREGSRDLHLIAERDSEIRSMNASMR